MKHLNQLITEYIVKKKLNTPIDSEHIYHPKDKSELIKNIKELLDKGETDLNCIDTSAITDMSRLFSVVTTNIDVSKWDVSKVTNMNYMFNACENFDCDLSNWDVSNVTSMESMFNNCRKFTGKGLENWNISNVENMNGVFNNCFKFNCDLSNWDVSQIKSTIYMFCNCYEFNCNLSKWNVSNIRSVSSMFIGCEKFKGNGLEKMGCK